MITTDAHQDDILPALGPDLPDRPGDLIGDRYLLSQIVGTGGTGTVWSAEDTVLRRPVALKAYHGGSHAEAEAAAVSAIDHPGGVTPVRGRRSGADLHPCRPEAVHHAPRSDQR
ncbi:hypothetical protein [Kineosporia babensis]|uniref:Protein kinase domain-containing protein n=1 Tax=Kineosporia babensis TaxID=499548 RepID=A0A9X1NKJ7_9ACTN|nr:hypothetical protein [Kineosporia babensis]MCD5314871.1 hypothetical protein [Kineosporia babensis]